MYDQISNVIVAISAAIVALAAIFGINTWRRELGGKTKFEICRQIMKLIYKIQADYQSATSPLTSSGEAVDRPKQDKETDKEAQVLNEHYARQQRLGPLIEDVNKLVEASWEAKIILGSNVAKIVEAAHKRLKDKVVDLMVATGSYFEIRLNEATSGIPYNDKKCLKEMRDIVFQTHNSEANKQIEETISELDSVLEPYVRDSTRKEGKLVLRGDKRFWAPIAIAAGLTITFFGIAYTSTNTFFGWFDIIAGIIIF